MTRTPDTSPGRSLYHEEQRFRQWWAWVFVVGPAALAWWLFIGQIVAGKPIGQNPAPDWAVWLIWLFIGIGLPAFFGYMALVVDVTLQDVVIRFRPFSHRVIALSDIARVQARKYNAVKEYGGWGIRGWSREKMAYNVHGDRGAELTLGDGRQVLIGSQRADELAAAIEAQLRSRRS